MSAFVTNRSLLNAKFEGYKLSPLSDEVVAHHPLPSRPTQATASGRTKTPLSFAEVQSRITHNHLAISSDDGFALYVDEQLQVIRININPDSLEPTFQTIYELPKSITSPEQTLNIHKDYPSVIFLCGDIWLVSDGYGQMYVLKVGNGIAQLAGVYNFPNDSRNLVSSPFKIHAAHLTLSSSAICVLSCLHNGLTDPTSSTKQPKKVTFDVFIVSMSLTDISEELRQFEILWHGQGDDVPMYCFYNQFRDAFFVVGSSTYRQTGAIRPPSYVPLQDEIAPIPRLDEKFTDVPPKPPPYSWTQTADSVTVAFPLPSHTPKSAIKVTLTALTLTLLVNHELPSPIDLPRFSFKRFWDGISQSSSFWTWDKEGEHQYGLLTLHLDKQHEGTKWPHVFASVGNATSDTPSDDPTDAEVPETVDPSELWLIREALERYTSALRSGEDASGLGLGTGVPSLADGEMDDEVDASVGRKVCGTWIGVDGSTPGWAKDDPGFSTWLLSTPLPGIEEEASLVIKNNIDGLFFTLPSNHTAQSLLSAWIHTSTYPVLAFVLASKRDMRFTFHMSSQAVLVFESGSGPGGGNVYIYRSPVGRSMWAKQAILKIASGNTGALIGVGAVKRTNGGYAVLCLCEGELAIVKDFY